MSISDKKQGGFLPPSEWQVQQPRFFWLRLLFSWSSGVLGAVIHILFASSGLPVIVMLFITPLREWFTIPLAVAIPLSLGIAGPFIVGRARRYIISVGMVGGFIAWLGMAMALLIWSGQQEAAEAAQCHQLPSDQVDYCLRGHGYLNLEVIIYLFGSIILIVLSGLVTGLVIKLARKSYTIRKRFGGTF